MTDMVTVSIEMPVPAETNLGKLGEALIKLGRHLAGSEDVRLLQLPPKGYAHGGSSTFETPEGGVAIMPFLIGRSDIEERKPEFYELLREANDRFEAGQRGTTIRDARDL